MSAKRVVVTGASRGIGRATALTLAQAGWMVAAVARGSDDLHAVARDSEQMPGSVLVIAADMRTTEGVGHVCTRVLDAWNGVDVLINNAGVFTEATIADLKVTDLDDAWATNARAAVLMTQALIGNLMEARGHVINIGSRSAIKGLAGEIAFCASKYALAGFSASLRDELRGTGVRVSCLHPGPVNTWGAQGADADGLLAPNAVAELIKFVAEGDAEYYDTRLGIAEQ